MRRRTIFFIILACIFSLFIIPYTTFARVISSETAITIEEGEVIDEDVFVAAETVIINGTVNGDVYAAGERVEVNGTINGDLLVGASIVEISGTISDDVRAAGGTIRLIRATIGDDASLAGGEISIDDETTIGGSFQFGTGEGTIDAQIGGEVFGGAATLFFNGHADKTVRFGGGEIEIGSQAGIEENLIYYSNDPATIHDGALIKGEIQFKQGEDYSADVSDKFSSMQWADKGMRFGFSIWSYISSLLVGIIIIYFFKPFSQSIILAQVEKLLKSIGWGVIMFMITGPVIVLLLFTLIGVPVALILGGLFLFELYVAHIFSGMMLGELLVRQMEETKRPNLYLRFALGLLGYYLLVAIPVVGFFLYLVFGFLALGAIFLTKRHYLFSTKQ